MKQVIPKYVLALSVISALELILLGVVYAQETNSSNNSSIGGAIDNASSVANKSSSYMPVVIKEDFVTIMARYVATKPEAMQRQMDLLNERYDLSNRMAKGVTMSRGKPIQDGVRVKLPGNMTWDQLVSRQ